ncbi:hypothetical protein A3C91_02710 [Candidatus Azambacteria bacterium RIFCSPHIGHO2_02_FULL_52_12]|uniref:PKD domain-containing protein n=1 Tax=Candidatus Azambacteria bacterium RIFCSPLOWO2_01_FULL_46_25 TaxID=1797298 RepID=A0A1F5BTI0_9BACT|nr:MAG: hypothetical protein A3C91_02710 [Candidatus Azambacteria bacterium RIFCSPHIGHO2_02_FULL_52_12]OGD33912.1 MAG: hypothetical protein A2988_00255 [Candidatus Azambacteria bacterium RIFCSPLOWO2_01_FULL_46_25]OGD37143.1 MAG: hypothetical protein A2850_04195 [Candidatus Azambacteria bacterium RIFCSPHIGHO2_01_FULL_51_74]
MQIIKIAFQTVFLWGIPLFVFSASPSDVVINEIAWIGTKANSADEWVELKNNTASEIDLAGFGIYKDGGSALMIALTKKIPGGGYYLIERTDDSAVANVAADDAGPFAGSGLGNSGEHLVLKDSAGNIIDSVNSAGGWPAGIASPDYKTMERDASGWHTNDGAVRNGADAKGNPIQGTPKAANSAGVSSPNQTQEQSATSTEPTLTVPQSSSTGAAASQLQADAGENIVGRAHDAIFFNGLGTGGTGGTLIFTWNFGDGAIEKKAGILHQYQFPGTYIATLTASDGTRQSDDQIEVRIFPDAIAISEFMPNPEEGGEEWIELSNSAGYSADISGWGLGTKKEKPSFLIPDNTFLAHDGFLVFPRNATQLAFGNAKGSLFLFYPNGQSAGEVAYENPRRGFSAASRNGTQFFWTKEQTPGMKNVFIGTTASRSGGAAAVVGEEKGASDGVSHNPAPFAVYEKQGGIKSFLGQPAFAAVISDATPLADTDSREKNMAASVLGAFSWVSFLAVLSVLAASWIGLRYVRKKKAVGRVW